MLFSSITFLFLFLPVVMAVYYIVPNKAKNVVFLIASLFFYAWGEPVYVVLMILSILFNYFCGRDIKANEEDQRKAKRSLAFAVAVNVLILGFFKYYGFILNTLNSVLPTDIPYRELPLPVGISFYTFQAISYLVDIYRKKADPQKNILYFALYISMFPQLIAGPIVKYRDVAAQLHVYKHRYNIAQIEEGMTIFTFGLAKKVLLADAVGALWTDIIGVADDASVTFVGLANASTGLVWLGILAYSFQLYFDFSGYSMMAIGMGKMMGFEFPQNFNYPYISASITEFWRRWHMTLSSWFREYVYIPLGGNRKGLRRQIFNLFIVELLTGIWHGANWNFICWGLYYFVLLAAEKLFLLKHLQKGRVWPHLYTLFFVVVGWAMFVGNDPGVQFGLLFQKLFTPSAGVSALYFLRNYGVLLAVSFVCCTPLIEKIWDVLRRRSWSRVLTVGALLVVSTAYVVGSTNSPFLYFNF